MSNETLVTVEELMTQLTKVWRYTFHFPSGVVFHSSKRKYTRRELQTIERGSRQLEQQHKEGYSVKPNPEPQP